jgi:inhibitor of KinA
MKLEPLGDSAVVATLGPGIDAATLDRVMALARSLGAAGRAGITDIVPAYSTVTAFYDPAKFGESPGDAYGAVCRFIDSCAEVVAGAAPGPPARLVEIPVCYGGEFGPDIAAVAQHCGLGPGDVARIHSGADYLVHAIGFTPGFPYLGGLPEALRTPRRDTPRAHVPAGSVAIGGQQTGVYPVDSPGGWQIIGRTPIALFRPRMDPAALLRLGDRVRFKVITESELESWR